MDGHSSCEDRIGLFLPRKGKFVIISVQRMKRCSARVPNLTFWYYCMSKVYPLDEFPYNEFPYDEFLLDEFPFDEFALDEFSFDEFQLMSSLLISSPLMSSLLKVSPERCTC